MTHSKRFTADSPAHAFACACGSECVDVIPDPEHGGIITVRSDGDTCCSEFEGEFGVTGELLDLAGAIKQAAMSKAWAWARSHGTAVDGVGPEFPVETLPIED